ncbi:hypothetical protein HOP50_01g02940 [Chloropicon primus]|uniref:Uncharacterized protein n=1 Tax=Chloropicon primus TaxID=1764295 RepID=A0A5B8MBH7_9CHLO|nr:hypothetical protein A3770_01p03040 [Chloropicon primus]UPQ97003.1 hypothetical protein HOP50_01g02940 [Chloropicon primus]|eukprot:QDZ17786.1 hypothetical protein A3770_01p03040 [Chloropicon primus]
MKPKDLPTVGVGFQGKGIVDPRSLTVHNVETLSRSQIRDIIYALGQDKPAWNTVQLKEQIKGIVHALQSGSISDMKHLENQLGITLPKGNAEFQFRSVPHAKQKPRQYTKDPTKYKKPDKGNKPPGKDRFCASCGQRARSNCFYRCCKQCCVQLKNPCTVHVLTGDKVVARKGYGSGAAQYQSEYNAFPIVPEDVKAMPGLRDLRENLDAYHEESKEVLEWRRNAMKMCYKADEEAAVDALGRYERNANLLAQVMKVERMEDLLEEKKRSAKRLRSSGEEIIKNDEERAEFKDWETQTNHLEMYNNVPTPLDVILKKLAEAKTVEELRQSVQQVGVLKDVPLEKIQEFSKWFEAPSAASFKVLKKVDAPRPVLKNVVELKPVE